jgi:hypothetical protein
MSVRLSLFPYSFFLVSVSFAKRTKLNIILKRKKKIHLDFLRKTICPAVSPGNVVNTTTEVNQHIIGVICQRQTVASHYEETFTIYKSWSMVLFNI